jgi:hypothetical protein
MLYTKKSAYHAFQFLVILALGCLMVFGCQKSAEKSNSDKTDLSMEIHFIQEYYTPLDLATFNAILNDTQNISGIGIYYSKPWAILSIPVNNGSLDNLFSEINSYQGELLQTSGTPLQSDAYSHDFSASEIQDIFDYLLQNSDYFFNGEEYEGIYPPPIEAITIFEPVCSGEYAFSLHIGFPNQMVESWTIHKCIDEYPYPDHPLYVLFEMLENDFIPQFEE